MSAWWLILIVPVMFSFGFYFVVNGLIEAMLGASCVFSEDEDGVIDVDCEVVETKELEVKK